MKRPFATVAVHALLAIGALVTLTPLLWMVSASFMPSGQASSFPPPLLPTHPTLQHRRLLPARSFRDVDQALRLLKELVFGPGYGHISNRTTELAWRLVPKIIALCPARTETAPPLPPDEARLLGTDQAPPRLSDPDRVLVALNLKPRKT